MTKNQNKTQENSGSVEDYLSGIVNDKRRQDTQKVMKMMKKISKTSPKMWGTSIIGFGKYHYKYDSGREGDFMKIGLAARKQSLTLYIMPGFKRYSELMAKLGNYKTGKSCLYIKKLEDIDEKVLSELIEASYGYMTEKYA